MSAQPVFQGPELQKQMRNPEESSGHNLLTR